VSRKKQRKQIPAFPRPAKDAILRVRRRALLARNATADPELAALRERLTPTNSPAQRQLRADVERFKKAKQLERRAEFLAWEAARDEYTELLERPGQASGLVVECLHGLARVLQVLRQRNPSEFPLEWNVDLAQRLVRIRRDAGSHSRLGQAWLDLARPHDALAAAEAGLALNPEHLPSWELTARCYRALGDRLRARQTYEHMLSLPVNQGTLHWRATALLMTENYAEGYPAYNTFGPPVGGEPPLNWRGNPLIAGPVPLWTGEPLPDGRLLLFQDGGFGDVFQMLRWVPIIRPRVGALRLAVSKSLIGFCCDQGWDVEVVPREDCGVGYDRWLNSDGIPGACGCARPEDVPPAPYLHATHVRAPLVGTFRVGLVWAGQPGHPEDELRSTSLADWAPVLAVPGVRFYSLQLGSTAKQVAAFEHIHDLSSELTDWRDTAAVLHQLDLLITVDSAVANLAGALGRPTWVCLYPVSDWRWLLDGSTTPWYGSARLFRQPRVGDWASVFGAVATELRQLVSAI
jgi:tetratricopeptide (TPR) repeat protein